MTAPQGFPPNAPMPPPRPKVIPVLHLIGSGLIALGVVFVLLWINALADAFNRLFSNSDGGAAALLVFAGLFLIAGVMVNAVARFMESKATAFIVGRMPGP